jgi:ABC-type hemin transport system substrate-binding protein
MKRFYSILLTGILLSVLLFSLSSCKERKPPVKYSEQEAYPVTIENITLTEEPASIVCLSQEILNAVNDLGMLQKVVGISSDSTQPESQSLPQVGTAQKPDTAQILSLKPSLVITSYPFSAKEMSDFQSQSIQVLVLPIKQDGTVETSSLILLRGNPQGESQAESSSQ